MRPRESALTIAAAVVVVAIGTSALFYVSDLIFKTPMVFAASSFIDSLDEQAVVERASSDVGVMVRFGEASSVRVGGGMYHHEREMDVELRPEESWTLIGAIARQIDDGLADAGCRVTMSDDPDPESAHATLFRHYESATGRGVVKATIVPMQGDEAVIQILTIEMPR